MRTLKEKREMAGSELAEHCREIIKRLLTPEQLSEVDAMTGKNTKLAWRKGQSKLNEVYRNNPLNIKAKRTERKDDE